MKVVESVLRKSISWCRRFFRKPQPQVRSFKPKKPRHLPISPVQQKYAFSCCASVLQVANEHLTGTMISHEKAIRLTGCRPDGAEFPVVASALSRLSGARWKSVARLTTAHARLRSGGMVIACDNKTYADPHAVLMVGATRQGFYIFDPAVGSIKWRPAKWVRETTDEYIVILPKSKITKSAGRGEK